MPLKDELIPLMVDVEILEKCWKILEKCWKIFQVLYENQNGA
jgi:hypothetical protein